MKLSAIFKHTLNESDWGDEHDRLTKQEIEDWCASVKLRNIRVEKEGKNFVINCQEDVRIRANDLPLDDDNMCYLPYQFGEVNGNFIIITNGREKLRSLKNGPITVYGRYSVPGLGIESLEGMAGSVQDRCDVSGNQLKDWDGIPSQCGELIIHGNKITTFTGISKNWIMGSVLQCDPIERGVLELLQVEGLEQVKFVHNYGGTSAATEINKAQQIINDHLQGDRDVLDMQSDFIDADMTDWVRK